MYILKVINTMEKITSTLEFAKKYPEAFAALPECYQNDDVLEYYKADGFLYAQAKESERFAVGDKVYMYYTTWEETDSLRF